MIAMSAIVMPKIAQEITWVSSRLLIRSFSIISADYRERAARLPPSLIAPRPRQRHPEQPRLFRQCGGPRRHGVCGLQRATLESTAHYRNGLAIDRKSTRLNSSHVASSYAVFCLKK